MKTRSYRELQSLKTFDERFKYLKLDSTVGQSTFGFDRILNQIFYKSEEWKAVRRFVIIRDTGCNNWCCDLGIKDNPITGPILVHHMNPIDVKDIEDYSDFLLNPEYLISTQLSTHNPLHFGLDLKPVNRNPIERTRNDMNPWRK